MKAIDTINPSDANSVKIAFCFHSNVLDEWTVETLWAQAVDMENGLYKIDNTPFYASVAVEDIVHAEFDDIEERLIYKETVEYSGNSTIQVVIMKQNTDTNVIREIFDVLNCESEKFKEGYFVINVPEKIDYLPIKERLLDLENKGIISYAESCLSENHWYLS